MFTVKELRDDELIRIRIPLPLQIADVRESEDGSAVIFAVARDE